MLLQLLMGTVLALLMTAGSDDYGLTHIHKKGASLTVEHFPVKIKQSENRHFEYCPSTW